ncbi:hypothetical protein IFM61606_08070 [Aspergillus udagawae]|nr:hypothetical protein IFM61606_08070 [Aspergillus udagawae]
MPPPLSGASSLCLPPALPRQDGVGVPPLHALHAELLHSLMTETMQSLAHGNEPVALIAPVMIRQALKVPYLLNQLLALAALCLSRSRPTQRDYYHFHATQLQTHAISFFNKIDMVLSVENCASVFLFSSALGIHMLCETLNFRASDMAVFLNRFVQSVRLYRAVRTVASQTQTSLEQSDLGGLWRQGPTLPRGGTPLCEKYAMLKESITAAKLGPALTTVYTTTIECLQSVVKYKGSLRPPPSAIVAWPVLVPEGYLECLRLRRPEALVILAHYAILLHLHRGLWIFGDSGSFLIKSISQHLGPEWEGWMDWPQQALESLAG